MEFSQLPWWRTDEYSLSNHGDGLDLKDSTLWGPEGPALVPYFPATDKTGPGWGRDSFMASYKRQVFRHRRVLAGVDRGLHDYAFVRRAARLVCIDIDGKNGGLEYASRLGYLPPTLSEVSKSGNGYHLFYLTDEEWDEHEGYAKYRDTIGLVTGVDIRATGCVYHKKGQRWNTRGLAPLPAHLSSLMLERQRKRAATAVTIEKTLQLEPEEIAMMHDALITELNKPIPNGKRNLTLFAIGSQMFLAKVENWAELVKERGRAIGLDEDELEKLAENIKRYGAK